MVEKVTSQIDNPDVLQGMITIINFWETSKIYVPSFCERLRNLIHDKLALLNEALPS